MYQDHLTKSCVLRPVQSKRPTEAASPILDLCLLLGAPAILQSDNATELTANVHSFHWLPIEQRIEYKLSLLCFKIISLQAPIYLSELLHLYTPSRQLRSSTDTRMFRIPSFRTSPVVSALSLTRLQLFRTNSLYDIPPLSAVLNLP